MKMGAGTARSRTMFVDSKLAGRDVTQRMMSGVSTCLSSPWQSDCLGLCMMALDRLIASQLSIRPAAVLSP